MPKTVKIGVDDACMGLETDRGQVFPVKDHVAEVPVDTARSILNGNRAAHLHRHRPVAIGWTPRSEATHERIFGKEQ